MSDSSGGSRISHRVTCRGVTNPCKGGHLLFGQFPRTLHENEEILVKGAYPWKPSPHLLVDPFGLLTLCANIALPFAEFLHIAMEVSFRCLEHWSFVLLNVPFDIVKISFFLLVIHTNERNLTKTITKHKQYISTFVFSFMHHMT